MVAAVTENPISTGTATEEMALLRQIVLDLQQGLDKQAAHTKELMATAERTHTEAIDGWKKHCLTLEQKEATSRVSQSAPDAREALQEKTKGRGRSRSAARLAAEEKANRKAEGAQAH